MLDKTSLFSGHSCSEDPRAESLRHLREASTTGAPQGDQTGGVHHHQLEEEEEEELTEDSDENSYSSQDDSKAVAVIRSVGELSVPEKYKSTHQIRVSASLNVVPLLRQT